MAQTACLSKKLGSGKILCQVCAQSCGFIKYSDEFSCTHISLFYLKYKIISCSSRAIKRYLFNKETFDSLLKIKLK